MLTVNKMVVVFNQHIFEGCLMGLCLPHSYKPSVTACQLWQNLIYGTTNK